MLRSSAVLMQLTAKGHMALLLAGFHVAAEEDAAGSRPSTSERHLSRATSASSASMHLHALYGSHGSGAFFDFQGCLHTLFLAVSGCAEGPADMIASHESSMLRRCSYVSFICCAIVCFCRIVLLGRTSWGDLWLLQYPTAEAATTHTEGWR